MSIRNARISAERKLKQTMNCVRSNENNFWCFKNNKRKQIVTQCPLVLSTAFPQILLVSQWWMQRAKNYVLTGFRKRFRECFYSYVHIRIPTCSVHVPIDTPITVLYTPMCVITFMKRVTGKRMRKRQKFLIKLYYISIKKIVYAKKADRNIFGN